MTESMGHGVNQRKTIEMTPEEIEGFLAERRAMSMCLHWSGWIDSRRGDVVRLS